MLDGVEQAWAEEAAAVIVFADLEVAGAELECFLEERDGFLQGIDAGEGAVEFDAFGTGFAGDVDAGKFIAGGDHEVGVRFVIK